MAAYSKIYAGRDPRREPAYPVTEAARYLGMPRATLRAWAFGQKYRDGGKTGFFKPVLHLADRQAHALSFMDLVEAHVLVALRTFHHVPMPKVRTALGYLQKAYPSPYPLATHDFETDGIDLFVEKYGNLINASRQGQTEMKAVIGAYLARVERDTEGIPIRLFPFTRDRDRTADQPRPVVIDPHIAFGKPVLVGTNIPTQVIAERYKAGDTITSLAEDYDRTPLEIEEAIRCEFQAA